MTQPVVERWAVERPLSPHVTTSSQMIDVIHDMLARPGVALGLADAEVAPPLEHGLREAGLAHGVQGLLEVLLGLAGEADDDVGGDRGVGDGGPHPVEDAEEPLDELAALAESAGARVVGDGSVEITELVADLDPDSIRKMLEVNILGTSLGIKHAFRVGFACNAFTRARRRTRSRPSFVSTMRLPPSVPPVSSTMSGRHPLRASRSSSVIR